MGCCEFYFERLFVCFVCFSTRCSLSSHLFTVQVEKLALAAEQQQGGEVRARASFLVLTQTLLLSLGELNETKHMLAAQRVYLLLEPPLLVLIRNSSSSSLVTPPSSFKLSSINPTERTLTQSLCCSRRQSLMSASLSPSLQH